MWEERISRVTHPAILLEHVLRYRMAMPILKESGVWADLGCGAGIAASRALDERFSGCAILVDKDQPSLDAARDELVAKTNDLVTLSADLSSDESLERLATELRNRAGAEDGCITCFEVVEHLESFLPLLDLLKDVTEQHGYTAILSVPNDSFMSIENPHHKAIWGAESFEEMLRQLPGPTVVAHQYPIFGSCIGAADVESEQEVGLHVRVSSDRVPSHYLVAFGRHAQMIASVAEVLQGDLERQRSWERQREAYLEFLKQREEDLVWLLGQCQEALAREQDGTAADGRATAGADAARSVAS